MYAATKISLATRMALAACLCLGMTMGCGDDDTTGDNNNTLPDAAVDAAPDATTGESITFLVKAYSETDATFIPTVGANVAFDAPGGERTELDTGADGKATFHGIDWTAGEAAVTFHLFGHVMVSSVNITPDVLEGWADENGEYPVALENRTPPPPPETVTVSGTATGLDSTAHQYTVNAVNNRNCTDEWRGSGSATYSIQVPSGEPFIIQSVEFEYTELPSGQGYDRPIYQRMHMDYGPIIADTTDVEVDFTTYALPEHTAGVSMLLPPRPDSPLRTSDTPYCYFCAQSSNFCHGWPTYLDVVDNQNRVDISFQWVEPAYALDVFWFCRVRATTGEVSQTRVPGTPTQESQGTMMDPPTWVTPADPQTAHPLHQPMEWVWREEVEVSTIVITRNGIIYWTVNGYSNATPLTVPMAPSFVDEAQLLGSTPRAHVQGGTMDEDSNWIRYSASLSTLLEP